MSRISCDVEALLSQVSALTGGALSRIYNVCEWRSATFAGHRIEACLFLNQGDCLERAQRFQTIIHDHEFHLPRQFVADINVAEITQTPTGDVAIHIEALLLDL